MKKYNNIDEVWKDLERGKTIFWTNESYKVYIQDARSPERFGHDYDLSHFTFKNGKVLDVRFIETFWGARMDQSDLLDLFSKEV